MDAAIRERKWHGWQMRRAHIDLPVGLIFSCEHRYGDAENCTYRLYRPLTSVCFDAPLRVIAGNRRSGT